jgi:tetratricopeptide (TPR) repeat protein
MNFKKLFFTLWFSLVFFSVFGQQDGYWDKERATKKEIIVSARDRIIIKTDDFPVGTTELVYRITLLDDNQKLANSLVSVLKSIPDPTGISQGSAGAVFLLSKISGNDKCKYAVFTNEIATNEYLKKGLVDKSCFFQKEAISKDVKRITNNKSSCLTLNTSALWFGFESSNWIMKQKIILEVVPWVNTKLSRGWNVENREKIFNLCKLTDIAKKIPNADSFCLCVSEKLQKEYSFQEFQQLLSIEKTKKINDLGVICFDETDASKTVYFDLQKKVSELIKKENYGEAILILQTIITNKNATSLDYNSLGFALIVTKQFEKAIQYLKVGEKLDGNELLIKMNLAHAYLLKKDFRSAKSIHKKFQYQNVTDSLAWTEKTKLDFEIFKKANLESTDFEKILRVFK